MQEQQVEKRKKINFFQYQYIKCINCYKVNNSLTEDIIMQKSCNCSQENASLRSSLASPWYFSSFQRKIELACNTALEQFALEAYLVAI